ncbi:MAG: glycosyltransferase [Chloroflexi bacterium]|nr:glycosyltransferase [Chloroflexota bacterium]
MLFPAEINAACPNSVIEALACGLPVVSYATGSIPELVGQEGGITVPYGANYWKLEAPKTEPLAKAAAQVLDNQEKFRKHARKRAEENFSLDVMVERYLKVLIG